MDTKLTDPSFFSYPSKGMQATFLFLFLGVQKKVVFHRLLGTYHIF